MCAIQIFVNQYSHKLYRSQYISLVIKTSKDHKRKGYMTEALDGYLKNLFKRHPDTLVINGISSGNKASQDLHIKFGFIPIESKSIDGDEYMINKKIFEETAKQREEFIQNAYEKEKQFHININEYDSSFELNFLRSFNI